MEPEDFKKIFANLSRICERQLEEHLAKPGWSALKKGGSVWDKFEKIYNFRPSTRPEDWPGISEPKPSRTFNIKFIYGPDFDRLTRELSAFYLTCFKNVTPKGQRINVLDWQHQCFTFDPHAGFEFETMGEWPITPLPNGDYYIFLTEDLLGGFFGHPWEQSICVMGDAFIGQLANTPKEVFSDLIRVDGVSV